MTELMALSLNLSHLDGHGSPYFPNRIFPEQFAEEWFNLKSLGKEGRNQPLHLSQKRKPHSANR